MKREIINILTEIIKLLNQTNWIKQAEWYKLKLELIKKTIEQSCEFAYLLREIDKSISGMGSFSDLPMKKEYSNTQWELSIKIVEVIKEYFNGNESNAPDREF